MFSSQASHMYEGFQQTCGWITAPNDWTGVLCRISAVKTEKKNSLWWVHVRVWKGESVREKKREREIVSVGGKHQRQRFNLQRGRQRGENSWGQQKILLLCRPLESFINLWQRHSAVALLHNPAACLPARRCAVSATVHWESRGLTDKRLNGDSESNARRVVLVTLSSGFRMGLGLRRTRCSSCV